MLPKSKARKSQRRNSRSSRLRYKDIHLTKGDLGLHEMEFEKSAEVIVPISDELSPVWIRQRSHKIGKD